MLLYPISDGMIVCCGCRMMAVVEKGVSGCRMGVGCSTALVAGVEWRWLQGRYRLQDGGGCMSGDGCRVGMQWLQDSGGCRGSGCRDG
jgi:hypothetical protein